LKLAQTAVPLSSFPSALALVEHLHTQRDGATSVPSASEIVGSLIQSNSIESEVELRNSVLVLSFIPMIHRTYREVSAWFREIESEDIAQQILALFLELVDSIAPNPANDHLPIALTRALRKNAFRWAEWEKRHAIQRETEKSQVIAEPSANGTFETVSILNDFLDHCCQIGILSQFERSLLVKIRIEGFLAKEVSSNNPVLSARAVECRIQRILKRLQKASLQSSEEQNSRDEVIQPEEFKSKTNSSTKARIFSLRIFSHFLPISKSRRQLSLDSSPKQSESKQPQFAAPQRNLSPTTPTLSSASGRTCVIQGTASQRRAAIRSSVFPPTLARHTKFGERLSSNPDAGLARIIRKELAGNEEILPQELRFPLALARARHIFLVHFVRNSRVRPNNGYVAVGERRHRLNDGVHNRYRAWSFARRHCGSGLDLRFW
jgi:hypothetical protein